MVNSGSVFSSSQRKVACKLNKQTNTPKTTTTKPNQFCFYYFGESMLVFKNKQRH